MKVLTKTGFVEMSDTQIIECNKTIEKIYETLPQETQKISLLSATNKLNSLYNYKRSNITITYNNANFTWSKPRHWEDWQGVVSMNTGIDGWYDDTDTPHTLSNMDVINISLLIFERRQSLFMAKKQEEIAISTGDYSLSIISGL